jgi:rhomboid protease GluP
MAEAGFGKRRFDRGGAYTGAPTPGLAPKPPPIVATARDAPGASVEAKYHGPICTIGILAGLILIFAAQETYALGGGVAYSFNYRSLLAFGGDGLSLIRQGQWWRLFAAPLLHANPGHIIGNGIVLALVGLRFERLIGWGWFLAVFFVSALGGDLVSIYSQDPQMIGVGASGAIMGLLACMLVCSFHTAAKGQQIKMRWLALRVMIPALLPLGGNGTHGGLLVDYSAHAGGATAGVVMGLLINALWPQGEPKPLLRPIAEWLGIAGLITAILGLAIVALHFPAYQAISATLAPDAQIPSDQTQAIAAGDDLVAHFPKDPRAHLLVAASDEKAGLYGAAISELTTALGETDQLAVLAPQTGPTIHVVLAFALLQQGDHDGARAAAAPVCSYAFANPKTNESLTKFGLCGAAQADTGD